MRIGRKITNDKLGRNYLRLLVCLRGNILLAWAGVRLKGCANLLLDGPAVAVLRGHLQPLVDVEPCDGLLVIVIPVVTTAVRVLDKVLRGHARVHRLRGVQQRHRELLTG